MITPGDLAEVLALGIVPDDEILGMLSALLPLSRWQEGRRVEYFHPQQGHVLDVEYGRDGAIKAFRPREGLTRELLGALRELRKAAVAPEADPIVHREVLFSVPEIKGFWRHGDDWQIIPAPPDAPRSDPLMHEHPFVLEYRVRASTSSIIGMTRRGKRLWELHLLLSLLLRGSVTRLWPEHQHHWMLLPEQIQGAYTAYLNEGYMPGEGFVAVAEKFSDTSEIPQLRVVPDYEYYSRRGIGTEDMDVPGCFDRFFELFESSDAAKRDRVLRASYWRDAAYRVWHTSKSLSFIAAINAIEALLPSKREGHTCPECGKWHDSPGPTARFKRFVETYAEIEGAEARNALYNLRSTFVHGGALHSLDMPRSWGAMEPAAEEHRSLHDTALAVARTAIRNWFTQHDNIATVQGPDNQTDPQGVANGT